MKKYESYKPLSELWLSSIPTHWNSRKIKYLFSERSEKGYPDEPLLVASQNMGVVPKHIYGNRTVEAMKDLHLLKLVRIGDFVISLRSFQGGIEYAYYQGIISPAYTIMIPKDMIVPQYFKHLAKSRLFIELLQLCVTGIREGQNIDYSKLKNHQIPVPPRSEQDQIVRYLDWQVSKINKLIAAKKKEIAELRELEQSIIFYYVTRGAKENPSLKSSGINWAREIPNVWSILFLSQVAEEQYIKNKGMLEDNLLSLSYGRIIAKDINTTEGLLPTSFEGYQIIYPGNIVLRLTDLQNDHKSLRTGLSREKGIITSAYTCLKVRDNILPEYLRLQLHAADLCKVFYGMGGGVRQSIGYKDIRRMLVFVPTVEEQEQIVTIITEKCKPIQNWCEAKNAEVEILQEFKTRLVSDVVTGQIDVRGIEIPEYEYVEEESDEETDDMEGADEEAEEQEE
jgi:type I restriction enzyme S subunit